MSVRDEVTATASVRNGRLYIDDRRVFDAQIRMLDPRWTLEVHVGRLRATRSTQANRFYFGVVLAALSQHTGYTVDELHDLMKMKFLPRALALCDGNGEVKGEFVMGGSTRKLTVEEFHTYLEQVRQFAAELDCQVPELETGAL